MSVERLSPEYDQQSEIEQANEIFAWLQQPSEDIPELSEISRYRLKQLAGDTDLFDVVGCIQGFEDDERIAVQLTIAGFDESLVKELINEEALKLAIKKVQTLFNPVMEPVKPTKSSVPVSSRKTVARTPRPRAAKGEAAEDKESVLGLDLFGMFLREIGRTALLDAQTEVELAKTIEAGLYAEQILKGKPSDVEATIEELEFLVEEGRAAKLRFIEANTRLSVSIAKKYYFYNTDLPDRSQIGMEGIIRAVEKFDYTKGYKFSTYATWWVRQAITRGEANEGTTIRLPVHMVEKLKAVKKLRSEMFKSFDEYPTDEELSKELGFDVGALLESVEAALGLRSLNELLDADGDTEFGDLFAAHAEAGYDTVEKSQFVESVRKALDESPLTEQERRVVWLRFGFADGKEQTLDAIATELGVTRERIRQIVSKTLAKLKSVPEFARVIDGIDLASRTSEDTVTAKLGVRQQQRIDLETAIASNGHLLTDEDRYVARAFIEEKNQTDAAKRLGLSAFQVSKSIRETRIKLGLQ